MTEKISFYKFQSGLTILLSSFFSIAFSQATEKIQYGNLDTNRISVEEFKLQQGLSLPDNLILDSAVAYFSIPGQNSIFSVDYFPSFDSLKF